MKYQYIIICLALTGCSNYPSNDDLNYTKYRLANKQAAKYFEENFLAKGSEYQRVYPEKFNPHSNINALECTHEIDISENHIIPGKTFMALELESWSLNEEKPIDYNKLTNCLKEQIDKEPLTRENLSVLVSDFNKEAVKKKYQASDIKLIENNLLEIKKDGVITLGEALQLYKTSDLLTLEKDYSDL